MVCLFLTPARWGVVGGRYGGRESEWAAPDLDEVKLLWSGRTGGFGPRRVWACGSSVRLILDEEGFWWRGWAGGWACGTELGFTDRPRSARWGNSLGSHGCWVILLRRILQSEANRCLAMRRWGCYYWHFSVCLSFSFPRPFALCLFSPCPLLSLLFLLYQLSHLLSLLIYSFFNFLIHLLSILPLSPSIYFFIFLLFIYILSFVLISIFSVFSFHSIPFAFSSSTFFLYFQVNFSNEIQNIMIIKGTGLNHSRFSYFLIHAF